MKGNIKTFKESETGKKVLKTAKAFKDNYQKIKIASGKIVKNAVKTVKWADKKTKNARENMKKIFQNIHGHFQKKKQFIRSME